MQPLPPRRVTSLSAGARPGTSARPFPSLQHQRTLSPSGGRASTDSMTSAPNLPDVPPRRAGSVGAATMPPFVHQGQSSPHGATDPVFSATMPPEFRQFQSSLHSVGDSVFVPPTSPASQQRLSLRGANNLALSDTMPPVLQQSPSALQGAFRPAFAATLPPMPCQGFRSDSTFGGPAASMLQVAPPSNFRPAAPGRHGANPTSLQGPDWNQGLEDPTAPLIEKSGTPAWIMSKGKLMKLFPFLFTFCCILGFMVPIWMTVHLSHDRTVLYWIGTRCGIAWLLPIVFFVGHCIHAQKKTPYKPVVLACLLVPSIVLLVVNDTLMTTAQHKADQLFSTDCDIVPEKRHLQRSWELAHSLFTKCLEETIAYAPAGHNLTLEVAQSSYRIQDCQDYPGMHSIHKLDWEYLWYLEDEHQCAGWCEFGPRLWTFKDVQDSCAVAAAQVFSRKIYHMSQQTLFYSVVVLVFSSLILIWVGPVLRARGFDW